MTNKHGVDEKDLIIRIHDEYINAEKFCKAMRELQRKARMVEFGLDEFSQTDIFTLQIARLVRDNMSSGGTNTDLPQDIIQILFGVQSGK